MSGVIRHADGDAAAAAAAAALPPRAAPPAVASQALKDHVVDCIGLFSRTAQPVRQGSPFMCKNNATRKRHPHSGSGFSSKDLRLSAAA